MFSGDWLDCNQVEPTPETEFALRFLHILHKQAFFSLPHCATSYFKQHTCKKKKKENISCQIKIGGFSGGKMCSFVYRVTGHGVLAAWPGNAGGNGMSQRPSSIAPWH